MIAPFYIDAHCHLTDEKLYPRAKECIDLARQKGVKCFMMGGVNPADWERQKEIKKQFPLVTRMSFGIHPWEVERESETLLVQNFEKLTNEIPFAFALGETGLDFYEKRVKEKFALQETYFKKQMELALQQQKPLVLHVVHAHARSIELVKKMNAHSLPLLIHRFSGSSEEAREWLKLGAKLSFEKTRVSMKEVPLTQLLLETDHDPSQVPEVYESAARFLGIELALLKEKVAENFRALG